MVKDNMLTIGGMRADELAQRFSTPLYVYDENKLTAKMDAFCNLFRSEAFDCEVLYASKAFSCTAIVDLAHKHGLCLDVVSGGELYTAKKAGFPMEKIYFHGNNKSMEELKMAFEYGIGCIVVDNIMEAEAVAEVSRHYDVKMKTMLRVNPGVEAHTHEYIVTAHVDSKFGISIGRMEEIWQVVKTLNNGDNLEFIGFHAHIGSQIFDAQAFKAEIETMCRFIADFRNAYGYSAKALDLGGGFAAYYTSDDHPIPLEEVCAMITDTCAHEKARYNLDIEKIMIEPGRSIVAEAGMSLYRVGFLKDTQSKKYLFVDGGMADNIRPALYQAQYSADLANKMQEPKTETYTIAGKCCESGDILIRECALPKAETNDLLVMYTTGAYGFSMASGYNRLLRPAVVFVKDGEARVVVRRESFEDLISLDCEVTSE